MNTYEQLGNCLFQFFLELVSDKSYTENQKLTFYVQQRLSQNGAVYDLMWKKCGRTRHATDDNIMRCMHFAFWIIEATDTHSEHVYLLLLHDKNSYANAPQCYVICTWLV